jgi:hypothetical protein
LWLDVTDSVFVVRGQHFSSLHVTGHSAPIPPDCRWKRFNRQFRPSIPSHALFVPRGRDTGEVAHLFGFGQSGTIIGRVLGFHTSEQGQRLAARA